jgi:hypothetical protein
MRERSCINMSRAEKLLSVLYNDQIGAGLVNEESTEGFAVLPRWLRLLGHVTLMVLISYRDLSFMLRRFRVRLCGCMERARGRVSTRRHMGIATSAGNKAACKLTVHQRFATTPGHLQGCIQMHMHPTLRLGGDGAESGRNFPISLSCLVQGSHGRCPRAAQTQSRRGGKTLAWGGLYKSQLAGLEMESLVNCSVIGNRFR